MTTLTFFGSYKHQSEFRGAGNSEFCTCAVCVCCAVLNDGFGVLVSCFHVWEAQICNGNFITPFMIPDSLSTTHAIAVDYMVIPCR